MSSEMSMRKNCMFSMLFLLVFCFSADCPSFAAPPVSGERNGRWATPMEVKGLPNLFQVTPDLYRSAQPDKTGMLTARNLGIRTVLSFRKSNKDAKISDGTGLILRRVPISTGNIKESDVIDALRIIHVSPKPVLVHCLHGADRTGLIIAMYRMVFQGWSKEEARDEMVNGGYNFHSVWTNIPKMIDKADIEAIKAKVFAGPTPNGQR